MAWRSAVVVVAVSASVLASGCLLDGSAWDSSDIWTEPGLYQQLGGALPDDFGFTEYRTPFPLPLAVSGLEATWDRPALVSVEDGTFRLGVGQHGDKGPWDHIISDRAYESPGAAFRAFAARMTAADPGTLDEWQSEFEAGDVPHYGDGVAIVHGPYNLDALWAGGQPALELPRDGRILRFSTADLTWTFVAPSRTLDWDEGGASFSLSANPADEAWFGQGRKVNLSDDELATQLGDALRRLGRPYPDPPPRFHHSSAP